MRYARHLTTHTRRLSNTVILNRGNVRIRNYHDNVELLSILQQNEELTKNDAENELRWIRQAIKVDPTLSKTKDGYLRSFDETLSILVNRRSKGEPLQYVLDFGPLTLKVRRPILIPRPETEYITSLLANYISSQQNDPPNPSRPLKILDLCTGSGCIALLLAHRLRHQAKITGIDISPDAIALAKENAEFTGLNDVQFRLGDLWGDLNEEKIDIIVSNPPYIPRKQWDELDASVKIYEDPLALVGDPEDVPKDVARRQAALSIGGASDGKGLAFYRRIARLLPELLIGAPVTAEKGKDLPRVAVEIGYGQGKDVEEILLAETGGLINRVEVWKDQYGVDRMVVGWT